MDQCRTFVLGALLLGSVSVAGQTPESGGTLRRQLTDALTQVAKGTCSETLLGPLVLAACEQQLSRMQPALQSLGAITGLRYRGVEQMPTGVQAEVYRVTFAKGQTVWMVAAGPNGKLTVLYSPG